MTGERKVQALNLEIKAQLVRSQRTSGDVARALGVSQTQASARLTGRITWRIDELWTVAELCRLSLPELITEAEQSALRRSSA